MKYFKQTINGKVTYFALFDENNILSGQANVVEITKEEYDAYLEQARKRTVNSRNSEINELKNYLSETDFKAIKYAEGLYTEEEYEPIRQSRQQARQRLEQLKN